MGFIIAGVFIFLGLLFQRNKRTWVAPEIIFCYLWGIISFFAALRLFGLFDVSIKTWAIIFVGTISFVIGAEINFTIKRKNATQLIKNTNSFISKKIFWILFIIVAVLAIIGLKRSIELLQQGYSLDLIRAASYGEMEIGGYIAKTDSRSYFFRILRAALQMIIVAVGLEFFISNPKKNLKFLIASFFLVIASTFTDGGRWEMAYFTIELFACYRMQKDRGKKFNNILDMTNKVKRRLLLFLVLLVIIIIYVTKARWSGDIVPHLYSYLCACVPLLDSKIKSIESIDFYSIIFAGQYGIWSLIIPTIQVIFNLKFNLYTETVANVMTTQQVLYVGKDMPFNAFVTSFYFLYADFRWIGLVIGMFLFGIVSGMIYRAAKMEKLQGGITLYLIIIQMIIKTIQNYPLSTSSYVLAIIMILLISIVRKISWNQ